MVVPKEIRESVVLKNAGIKLFGIVHRPVGQEKCPAVLFCHGLGGNKCGHYRVYVALAQMLSRAGIISLRVDFRGCGDSEGELIDVTLHDQLSDATCALKMLEKDPQVDINRIGFFGRSLGGAIALLTAAKFKKSKSLALWAPVYSGEQWERSWKVASESLASEQEILDLRTINGQIASLTFFKEMFSMDIPSALSHLIHTPLLHIHGEQDLVVTVQHAQGYEKSRQKANAPSKFIRLPIGDHEFSHAGEREYALNETLSWFKETL